MRAESGIRFLFRRRKGAEMKNADGLVRGGQGRDGEELVCAAVVVSACLAAGGALLAALWFWKLAFLVFGIV